jgi:hypothetical protein
MDFALGLPLSDHESEDVFIEHLYKTQAEIPILGPGYGCLHCLYQYVSAETLKKEKKVKLVL